MKTITPKDLELWHALSAAWDRFAGELAELRADSDGLLGERLGDGRPGRKLEERASPWLRLAIGKAAHEAREAWIRESAALSKAEARAKSPPYTPPPESEWTSAIAPASFGPGFRAVSSSVGESPDGFVSKGLPCRIYLREAWVGVMPEGEPAVLARFPDEWDIVLDPSRSLTILIGPNETVMLAQVCTGGKPSIANLADLEPRSLDELERLLAQFNGKRAP